MNRRIRHLASKLKEKIFRRIIKYYKARKIMKITTDSKALGLKVGFIVQLPAIWDKQVDIYNELRNRDQVETYLFVVPNYDVKSDLVCNYYDDNNYFLNNYPEAIKVYDDNWNMIDIREMKLDYLFYPRPYDFYLPKGIRSSDLYKYVRCCYIPYGLTGADVFDDLGNAFFDNMYCCFMDSDYQKDLLVSRYRWAVRNNAKKVYSYGYPVLSRFLDYPPSDGVKTITWTPRWSMDSVIGGSNFINFKDDFLELISNKNYQYIFRPHPLMFDVLIKEGIIDEEYKQYYLKTLSEYGVLYDTNTPIEEVFINTDLLITDYSSIIPQFFMTNRTIIYCEGGIELNSDYRNIVNWCYSAKNWREVADTLTCILENGDKKTNDRRLFIEKNFMNSKNASRLIANELIDCCGGRHKCII